LVKALIMEDKPYLSNHVDLAFKLGFPEIKLSRISNCEEAIKMVVKENPELLILNRNKNDDFQSKLLKKIKDLQVKPLIMIIGKEGEIKTIIDFTAESNEKLKNKKASTDLIANIKNLIDKKEFLGG